MNTASLKAHSASGNEQCCWLSPAKSARRLALSAIWMRRVVRMLAVSALLWVSTGSHVASVGDFELRNFKVGGDFVLTNQFGNRTSLKDLVGLVKVISFGFTNCPDICPTTMADLAQVNKSLGASAKFARMVFITVDPDRDTAERLKNYLAYFDKTIVGLTGSIDEITAVAGLYDTRFSKQAPNDGGQYSVDHTSLIYILDQQGRVRYVLPYGVGPGKILEGVRLLLDAEE